MRKKYLPERNIQLYPIYKMVSWDLLFYYCISFLFLKQIKGFDTSQIVFTGAVYPVFKFTSQIPLTNSIHKIGKRKSLIIGNFFVAVSIAILLVTNNIGHVILSQFFSAIGFLLKGMCENNLLYDSIPNNEKRASTYAKIDGKATSYYYYFDAISSIIAGFLFVINGYIPMVICFITCCISFFISVLFVEPNEKSENNQTYNIKKELKSAFYMLKKSKRIKYLILCTSTFLGILSLFSTFRSSLLTDIEVPEKYFGIIMAGISIISGISSRNQEKFHKRFKNKTLAFLTLPCTISCIFLGLLGLCNISTLQKILIISVFFIQAILTGAYYVIYIRYLNNFTTVDTRNTIAFINIFSQDIIRAGISFFSSYLLRYINTSYVLIFIGCISTIFFVNLFDKMKNKVGLKPEQYKKEELPR